MIRYRVRDTRRDKTIAETDDLATIDPDALHDGWVVQAKDAEAGRASEPLSDWADVPLGLVRARRGYATLPRLECKGLCARSCGPVMFSPAEVGAVEAASGRRLPVAAIDERHGGHWVTFETDRKLRCPLVKAGRCTVYEARPLLCRLFGLVPMMRCPYGCEPERWLTDDEGRELLAAIAEALPR